METEALYTSGLNLSTASLFTSGCFAEYFFTASLWTLRIFLVISLHWTHVNLRFSFCIFLNSFTKFIPINSVVYSWTNFFFLFLSFLGETVELLSETEEKLKSLVGATKTHWISGKTGWSKWIRGISFCQIRQKHFALQ